MPTTKRLAAAQRIAQRTAHKVEGFNDYRKMFDKLGKHIDCRVHRHAEPPSRPAGDDRHAVGQGRVRARSRCATTSPRRGSWREWPPKYQGAHADGQPGPLRRRLSPAVRVRLGRRDRQRSPRPTVGPIAPTAAAARGRRPSRCPRACTGTSGSARPRTAISTAICIRTSGTAGTISATARWATWPATCSTASTGR